MGLLSTSGFLLRRRSFKRRRPPLARIDLPGGSNANGALMTQEERERARTEQSAISRDMSGDTTLAPPTEGDDGQPVFAAAERRCFGWCYPDYLREEGRRPSSDFHFPKEQLPFHTCRIYLQGQNSLHFPWVLCSKLPPVVEQVVFEDE